MTKLLDIRATDAKHSWKAARQGSRDALGLLLTRAEIGCDVYFVNLLRIQKFFRVNGGSTQLKGVMPDIVLPDNYSEVNVGEKDNEHPMAWSQISAVKYAQQVVDLKKLPKIAENSTKRIQNNPTFKLIAENAHRIKQQRDNSEYTLNLKAYRELEAKQREISKKFENAIKPIDGFMAENLTDDFTALTAAKDTSKMIRNNEVCCEAEFTIGLFDLNMRKLVLPTPDWLYAVGVEN